MEIVLGIATVIGGIAAILFFCDIYKKRRQWQEVEKVVNSNWWESSELKKNLKAQGYKFRWSNADAVEQQRSIGYEIIYEEDNSNKKKYKLINRSGQVLIGKINR